MGQNEVYELLKAEREKGNDDYFSIMQVYRALIDLKTATAPRRQVVYRSIKKLENAGYLEVRGVTLRGFNKKKLPSYFRLKILKKDEEKRIVD